jgi:hypothetical protein
MNKSSPTRKLIVELLQLFASEERQLAYEQDVPNVDITVELVCMWFDDQYQPQQRHFDSCFTLAELAALERFHQFYVERVERLPRSEGTVRSWLASPIWREVMEQARKTIEQISN